MTISVNIPLQRNYMVEASAVGAAMQNLYNAAMEEGYGPGAAITSQVEDMTLVVSIDQREAAETLAVVPRRGRPPKDRAA